MGRETRTGRREKQRFRLYVTGTTPKSTQAVIAVKRLLEQWVKGRYELEVVDIYQQPLWARDSQIMVVPTLVREHPLPPRRIVGDLGCEQSVLDRLGLGKG